MIVHFFYQQCTVDLVILGLNLLVLIGTVHWY